MSSVFPTNEHRIERVLRVAAGLALIALAYTGSIGAWGYIGAIPVVTGLIGSCPIYTMLGMSTCPVRTGRSAN
jgi:hypothetical protein